MLRGLILAGTVGALAALWTWTTPGDPALWPAPKEPGTPVTLLDNGFHTDLVVPRAALASRPGSLADAVSALGPGDWILIGWGDAKFYVDQRPISDRLPDGARAFFRPGGNPSVLMLRPETVSPEQAFVAEGRRRLVLSDAAFDRLARRIEASLDLSAGSPRVAATRPGDPVRFFASRETFSVLHLCNHWVGEVLDAAGLPIRPVQTMLSSEIGRTVDRAQLDRAAPQA